MKTFKQHIKEGSDKTAAAVGSQTTNSVEDGSIGVHNIHDPDVLKRVNAFVGSIAECEYIKPQFAVDKLREKLQRIGLTCGACDIEGDKGNVTVELKQFGGRFGKDTMVPILMMMVYLIKKKVD